ncbi:MAG: hypothetical protein GY830_06765 [Bacteroidetes bacterium]|nr:hypothetical protein [Bacteroidota bacterium]
MRGSCFNKTFFIILILFLICCDNKQSPNLNNTVINRSDEDNLNFNNNSFTDPRIIKQNNNSKINEETQNLNFNIANHKIEGNLGGSRTLIYTPLSNRQKINMQKFCELLYEDTDQNEAKEWIDWIRSIAILTKKYGMDYYGFSLTIKEVKKNVKIELKANSTISPHPKAKTWLTMKYDDPDLPQDRKFNTKRGQYLNQMEIFKKLANQKNKNANKIKAIGFYSPSKTIIIIPTDLIFPTIIQFSKNASKSQIISLGKLLSEILKNTANSSIYISINAGKGGAIPQTESQLHFRISNYNKITQEDNFWLSEEI